jgi:cytochrome b pre-mRNA-processing protein 3
MLRRFMNLLLRPVASPSIAELYRACVAQARQPVFYAEWHVPDTIDGRFDLLLLHVLLVILRVKDHGEQTQQLFDLLFSDMDKNLREMGVSDIGIPHKMKPMLAAFYGRADSYEKALSAADDTLADALGRNVYGKAAPSPEDLKHLTDYVRQAHTALAQQESDTILSGQITFPLVATHD